MSRLRVAVIGATRIAREHLRVLTTHPECEVAVLCDLDAGTLAETAALFGIANCTQSAEQVVRRDDLDAVFVMVSILAAPGVVGMFLDAGIPTFLEKPPGLYSSETARLAERAERRGTIHMVGLNRRFYATQLATRAKLAAYGPLVTLTVEAHEDLARVYQGIGRRAPFPPAVIQRWAYANGIHALDLLRFFGGEVVAVHPYCQRVENDFPDCHSAVLQFASGAHGRALMDWVSPGGHRFDLRCVGASATSTPGFGAVVLAVRGQPEQRLEADEDDLRYKAGLWKQDSAFLTGVRAGQQPAFPAASLEDAHRTMLLIDQICQLPAAEGGAHN